MRVRNLFGQVKSKKCRDRLNGRQKRAIKNYEALCGFEFMCIDEINNGTKSFKDAWYWNVNWLWSVLAEVQNINTTGCGMY